jgi:hypothetical protein
VEEETALSSSSGAWNQDLQREVYNIEQKNVEDLGRFFGGVTFVSLIRGSVMTVTERVFSLRDTPFVVMVRRASSNALFEPGDTK